MAVFAPAPCSGLPRRVPNLPTPLHRDDALRELRPANLPHARPLRAAASRVVSLTCPLHCTETTRFVNAAQLISHMRANHSPNGHSFTPLPFTQDTFMHLLQPLGFWYCRDHHTFNSNLPLHRRDDGYYI